MKKFTRRHYNKKLLALGLSAFMGIGLTSTGFAAWVMSKEADENVSAGVNVSTITDQSANIVLNDIYSLVGDVKVLDNTFSFDAPTSDTSGRLYSDGTGGERLSVTISGKLYTENDYIMTASIDIDNFPEGIMNAIEEGYIAWADDDFAFTVEKIPGEDKSQVKNVVKIPLNDGGTETTGEYAGKEYKTFSFDVAFKWGEKFGDKNPSLYYDIDDDGKKVSDTEMQDTLKDFWYMITGETKTPDSDEKYPHEKSAKNLSFTVTLRAEISQATN